MSVPRLSGPRVTLRPPVDADIAARRALGTDPGIHRLFGGNAGEIKPYNDEMAAGWLRLMREHPHAWVIEAEGRMIGELRLDDVDMRDRRGTLALGILDPAALGLGYGTEAVRLVISHAFGKMGLHRIGCASSPIMNAPSAATSAAASSSKAASARRRSSMANSMTTS